MPLGNRIGTAIGRQSIRFTANSMESATIERGQLLYGLQLNVGGTLAVTAAVDNQAADIKLGDFESIIKQITVRANGSDTLFQMTGNDLWNLNRYTDGCPPINSPLLGDATTFTSIPLDTTLFIPFSRMHEAFYDDHLVDTRRLNSLVVDIQWGSVDDITVGAGRALTNVACNITPVGFSRAAGSDPLEEKIYAPIRRTLQSVDIVGAGDFELKLTSGPIYTGFLMNTLNGSSVETQILTNLSIESGTTKFVEWGWSNLNRFGESYAGVRGITYGRKATSFANAIGWAYLPNAYGGRISEGIDSYELGDVKIKGTATAAGKLRVFAEAITPVARVGKNVALTVTPANA